MTRFRRWLFLGLVLLGSQLSAGCYLGYTNRTVLFPNVALTPPFARAGGGCGPSCHREFGPSGCGGSLFAGPLAGGSLAGGPVVTGPVYDAPVGMPVGYAPPAGQPGCTTCGTGGGFPPGGMPIPIANMPGGPPIATTPPAGFVPPGYAPPGFVPTGGPVYGVPFDSGMVPTVKPPVGSVPLQMPNEVKESKKIVTTAK